MYLTSFMRLVYTSQQLLLLARNSMLSALYIIARPSVRPSVCHMDGSVKTVEVRITQFSPYSNLIPLVFRRDPPSGGVKQWWFAVLRETINFHSSSAFARWLTKLTFYCSYFKRIHQVVGLSRANCGVSCAFLLLLLLFYYY